MHARSGLIEMSPEKIDEAVEQFREQMIPRYREIAGYKGFTMLVSRDRGKALGVSFWESEEGVRQSDELGAKAREVLASTGGGSVQSREVWEVALDDEV